MSAICGLWHPSGREASQQDIDLMMGRLAHRGPDGLNTWRRGSAGLGHAMLHTTPESQVEQLPRMDAVAGLAITADAWLANRSDLAKGLGISSAELVDLSDSALILRAFVAYGEHCPEHLLGDFSFCVYEPSRQRFFCARDVQGIKPFYYHWSASSDLFCFGTEIKALLALEDVPADIAELRLAQVLVGLMEERTGTGFRAVQALPASHAMWVDGNGCHLWRYWHWDADTELRLPSQADYDEAFAAELTRAVHACQRRAFPLGAFLSGGLDSSSIVCLSDILLRDRQHDEPFHTFSAIFTGLPENYRRVADESEYIKAVRAKTNSLWHPIEIHKSSPYDGMRNMFWHVEDLPIGPNLYLHWAIYREAKQAGVRVMLDGIDGDTTVSHGIERLMELLSQGHWVTLWRETQALAAHYGTAHLPLLWHRVLRPSVPQAAIDVWRGVKGLQIPIWGANRLIRPEFAHSSGLVQGLEEARERDHAIQSTARQAHINSVESPVYQALFHMADKTSGASGVEARYPFFDRDLIQFCLSLPADRKLRDGMPRAILRSSMAGILPPLVAGRSTKGNLGANFMYQMIHHDSDQIERWAGADGKLIEPYVDLDRYREMLALFHAQPLHHQEQAEQLFWASTLGLWLERMQEDPRFAERPG